MSCILTAYARALKIHRTLLRISHGTSRKLAFHCVKLAFCEKKVDFFSLFFWNNSSLVIYSFIKLIAPAGISTRRRNPEEALQ